MAIRTATKIEEVNKVADVYVQELGITVTCYLLPNVPPLLSLGKLISENKVFYSWTKKHGPTLVRKGYKPLTCEVIQEVPHVQCTAKEPTSEDDPEYVGLPTLTDSSDDDLECQEIFGGEDSEDEDYSDVPQYELGEDESDPEDASDKYRQHLEQQESDDKTYYVPPTPKAGGNPRRKRSSETSGDKGKSKKKTPSKSSTGDDSKHASSSSEKSESDLRGMA